MLTRDFIIKLFDAASLRRWNDFVAPVLFTELDKQAHKMILAWVLAKMEYGDVFDESSSPGTDMNWDRLIVGGISEFLQRVVLTDLRPHIYHRAISERRQQVNEFVLGELEPMLTQVNPWFAQQVEAYLIDPDYAPCEKRLLHAAHFLATKWEFDIIYDFSRHVHGIENTRAEIENQIEDHYELIGVQKLALKRKTERFVSLCGQLRFQRRWAQSPRVPETSVLGHMLTVAIMSYLCTIDYTECEKRRYNNFFVALFHDLPEVLTRDIASPIKSAVAGLEDIVKEYEKKQMEERVLPFLPAHWRDEVRYFTENEFSSRVIVDGIRKDNVGIEELNRCYNENKYDPVDGDVLKVCDNLSAFVEACLSCDHGIQSRHLTEGISRLSEKYDSEYSLAGLPFGELFADFRKMAEPVLSEKEPVV